MLTWLTGISILLMWDRGSRLVRTSHVMSAASIPPLTRVRPAVSLHGFMRGPCFIYKQSWERVHGPTRCWMTPSAYLTDC